MKNFFLSLKALLFFFSFNLVAQDWEYYDLKTGRCNGWKPEEIKIDNTGDFSFKGINKKHKIKKEFWTGMYSGNLSTSSAEVITPLGEKMRNFEAKKDGDVWDIKLQMSWAGGGCQIKFKAREKS